MIAFQAVSNEEFCQFCWEELDMCQCYAELEGETWEMPDCPTGLPWHQVKSKHKKPKKQKATV